MERKKQQGRITQLPGENGFHARDGSLTKKKREQWEKEKAEAEQTSWFPFGRKSLSSKRAKEKEKDAEKGKERKSTDNAHNNSSSILTTNSPSASPQQQMDGQTQGANAFDGTFNCPTSATINTTQQCQMPMHHLATASGSIPSPLLPLYMEYPTHHHHHHLFPLPPNLIPIQHHHFAGPFFPPPPPSPYQMPMLLPGPPAPTSFLDPLFLPQQKVPLSVLPTPPFSGSSSSDSANSPPKDGGGPRKSGGGGTEEGPREEMNSGGQMPSANMRWMEELDRQVAERRMSEQMEAERRRAEERALEREEAERRGKEEEQRAMEERRRMKTFEVRDQHEQSCLDGIVRAQKEAELLKRAKLFRHILQDGEADMETAKEVLRAEDEQMVRDVLKQLRELEFQRRIASESIHAPTSNKSSPKQSATPRASNKAKDTMEIGEKGQQQQSPFNRANSWSVKQSRTMPTNQSMLPIPIRLKQQIREGRNKNGNATSGGNVVADAMAAPKMKGGAIGVNGQGRIFSPPTSTIMPPQPPMAGNKSKNNKLASSTERKTTTTTSAGQTRPAGLFEQLTLRRPRLGSSGAKEIEENKRMMALLNGQAAGKEQQQNGLGGKAQNDLNGNAEEEEDGAPRMDRNGNCAENGSSSANSPSSSSIETASVVKLRALLLSPSGSQEDLPAMEFPPLPLTLRTPVGRPVKNGGGGGTFLVPPSPFSRIKNAANEGNKDYFGDQGMRRSLRSPTMRRLQDSLQSLATIEGNNNGEGASECSSRSSTPKPFNCRNSQYRSFNMRRDTARQKQILEHLAMVRAQLKNSQAQLERTISKQNLASGGMGEGSSSSNQREEKGEGDDVFL